MDEVTITQASPPGWRSFVSAHAVWFFIVLTVFFTVTILILPLPVLAGPALVVFIPTLIAALLLRLTQGRYQVRRQLFAASFWKTSLKWIVISLGLGIGLRLSISLIGLLLVPGYQLQPGSVTPLLLITFLFAAAEEIGWRGYALPQMMKGGASPIRAAILIGIPWALLHLPLTLPGKLAEGVPPAAQFITMLSLSVITAWLYISPKRNLLAPVLLHGGQNAATILNEGLPLALNNWLMALVFSLTAMLIILYTRGRLGLAKPEETLL